jgi:hypothetical protein
MAKADVTQTKLSADHNQQNQMFTIWNDYPFDTCVI